LLDHPVAGRPLETRPKPSDTLFQQPTAQIIKQTPIINSCLFAETTGAWGTSAKTGTSCYYSAPQSGMAQQTDHTKNTSFLEYH
jgi:hypothetical protein